MKTLRRKRLRKYEWAMMNYPYTYIYAPKGFGKSTWKNHIIKSLRKQGTQVIECTSYQDVSFHYPNSVVYVLDDIVDEFITPWQTEARILCFSEHKPNAMMLHLISKQACLSIDPSLLLFTKDEIADLWKYHSIKLSLQEINHLYDETNGWALALHNILYQYPSSQTVKIMQEIYHQLLSISDIKFLCKLSMLSSFDEEQAFFITRIKNTSQRLQQLQQTCSFLTKEQNTYHFLPMFQEALNQDMYTYHIAKKHYYYRCAEYFQYQQRYYDAFMLFYKIRAFEAIYHMVDICEQNFIDELEDYLIVLCIDVAKPLIEQYPSAYLLFLTSFISYINAEVGNQYLQEFKAFTKSYFDEPKRSKLLAEIYLTESLIYHNDIPKCGLYNFKAYNLLNGNLINQSSSIFLKTIGSNQLLFLYYTQLGEFEKIYENLYHRSIMYNEIVNFTVSAYTAQLEGEHAYELGNYTTAIQCAKDVLFYVNKEQDVSLYLASLYLLGKSAILNGEHEVLDSVFFTLKKLINTTKQPRRKQMIHCIQANLALMCHRNDLIAPWLKQINTYNISGIYTINLQIYITIAKVAVFTKDFETLQRAIVPIIEINKNRHYVIVTIYIQLFHVFLTANHNKKKACEMLHLILIQSEQDHITSVYLDFTNMLYPLLDKLPKTAYMKSILAKMQKVFSFQQQRMPAFSSLSAKEYQIFLTICEGASRDEIALLHNISLNTVKFHMKNIYKKLGIHYQRELLGEFNELNSFRSLNFYKDS